MQHATLTARAVLLCSILLAVLAGCSSDDGRYNNEQDGYSIAFPEDWTVKEHFHKTSAIASNETADADSLFTESISIYVEPNVTVFADQFLTDQMQPAGELINFKEHTRDTLNVDGKEIPYVIYSHQASQNIHIAVMMATVVGNGKGYAISATARPDRFNVYKEEFRNAIRSFRVSSEQNGS